MDNKIFKKYSQIEAKIKELEQEKKLLREEILSTVKTSYKQTGEKSLMTPIGKFILSETVVWKYSDSLLAFEKSVNEKIKTLRDEVSKKKIWARGHGKAEVIDKKEQLSFRAKKGE